MRAGSGADSGLPARPAKASTRSRVRPAVVHAGKVLLLTQATTSRRARSQYTWAKKAL
jgi:hypothetical protein